MTEHPSKYILRRTTALILCLCMLASVLPLQVWAEQRGQSLAQTQDFQQAERPETLQTPEGEISVEEDWNETFPYGTFAFGNYQADVGEPGARTKNGEALPQSILIPVYRLGGTTGRVSVKITFAPAITTDAEGAGFVYDYAASGRDDLLIETEDPNPIAAYQTPGMPLWQREMQPGAATVRGDGAEEPVSGSALTLSLSGAEGADSWRWQAKLDGRWQDLKRLAPGEEAEAAEAPEQVKAQGSELCTDSTAEAVWDLLWDFEANEWTGVDLRCVYTVEGRSFCSQSLMGEVYEPIPTPEPVPADLAVDAEPAYTALEADEAYGVYEFDLTFADGETVKNIRVTALDDELSELPELALFTITGCEGGELSAACNTLTLMVSDDDEAGPSAVGFLQTKLTADAADCSVRIPVRREGDKSYNVTVRYETVDGTAKAGVDYAAAEGELAFAGSVDEIEIPVELIANGSQEERSFTLRLHSLQGGGEGKRCELKTEEITVTLNGSSAPAADGVGQNLATLLANPDGEELADRVRVAETALLGGSREPLRGDARMQESEALPAKLVLESDTRSHEITGKYKFTRNLIDNYSGSGYWDDEEALLGGEANVKNTAQNFTVANIELEDGKTDTWVNGDEINRHKYIRNSSHVYQWNDGQGNPVLFNAERIFANFSGSIKYKPDASFEGKYGTYFKNFRVEVEWNQVGKQETAPGTSLMHRYLEPYVSYIVNNNWKSVGFKAKGVNYSLWEDSRTYRCYTKAKDSWDAGAGEVWDTDYGEDGSSPEGNQAYSNNWFSHVTPSCKSIGIGMGQELAFRIALIHKTGWDEEETTKAKGLMNNESLVYIRDFTGERRVLEKTGNGLDLVIYTANDENELNAEDGFTPIAATSKAYGSLSPTVSLVKDHGGVTEDGKLYVGSKLKIFVPITTGFQPLEDGVFISDETGSVKKTATRSTSEDTNDYQVFYVSLIWDDMSEADLAKGLKLNVVYNRLQTIRIDVGTSVIQDGQNMEEKYDAVFQSLFQNASGSGEEKPISTKCVMSSSGVNENGRAFGTVMPVDWRPEDFEHKGDGVYEMTDKSVNLQSVHFGMNSEDVIVVNRRSFAGDADIVLTEADFKVEALTFRYYNKDFRDSVSPMLLTVESVELWYDGSYDGKNEATRGINGVFEEGEFIPAKGDVYIGRLKGEYPDSTFKPVRDENGVVHQYYLRVNYTMRPRSFAIPAGGSEDDRAQILPAFISAITDESSASGLTEEQQSSRWVVGQNVDGKYMYGAEADGVNWFDVPLGGDVSQVTMHLTEQIVPDPEDPEKEICESVTTYTWEPEYVGRLMIPFDNPTPIKNDDNITGKPVELAGETVLPDSDGVYAYTEAGRNNVNAFLGSLVGRSGLAVGVQQQEKPSSGAGGISSLDEIVPETVTIAPVRSTPSPDSLNNLQGDGDAGEANGAGPGGEIGLDDFAPDLGTELPSLEFPLGDYASIVMDGYQIGFSIGLPIFKKEDESYSGHEEHATAIDGSKITDTVDEHGNQIRDVVSPDGKKTTHMVTQTDPNDANKRTRTIETVTTDAQGKKSTRVEIIDETRSGGEWTGKRRDVTTNAPQTASTAASVVQDGEKSNFAEANGQFKTLKDFCKSVAKGDPKELQQFMKGSILDDNSFQAAKNGASKMKKVSVSFSVKLAIMFEYNPIDDAYFFKNAGISATLGFEVTIQARLPACPVFYVYLKFGAELTAGISMTVFRQAVEGDEIKDFVEGSPQEIQAGRKKDLVFALDMRENEDGALGARGFHMTLNGNVYMTVYDNKNLSGKALTAGALSGDGSQKEVLFEAYDRIVYVHLEARGKTWPEIGEIKPVVKAESKIVFDGVTITPALSLEVGAGVGVEVLKFEIFLKTNIAITMTMGGYSEESDSYEGFYISKFEWKIALGFDVTLLFVSYSMDVVAFGVEGSQSGTGGYFTWNISATLANGVSTIWSKTTYSTADAKTLDEVPEPYGTNIFKNEPGFTFYNPNGQKTNLSDNAGNGEGWWFRTKVSPNKWWGGGVFNGETPLAGDLSEARKKNAYVDFKVSVPEIDLYFKGKIRVWDSVSGKSVEYSSSPAKLRFGSSEEISVRVTALTEGTKLDRLSIPKKHVPQAAASAGDESEKGSLVHVNGPRDTTATQRVWGPGENTRAIDPTDSGCEFQLSGFNTSGDAKRLATGLATGCTYKLAQAGNEVYLVYPQTIGVPQLVLSRLVMTGDLNANGAGLVHPLDPENTTRYLILDDEEFMDLDFALEGSESALTVTWTTYGDTAGNTCKIKSRQIDLTTGTAGEVRTLQSSDRLLSLPAAAGADVLWAEAAGSGDNENAMLKAWLIANKGLKEELLPDELPKNLPVGDPSLAGSVFFWATQSTLNKLNGDRMVLRSSGGQSLDVKGQIENLDAVSLNGKTYVFYSTASAAYFDLEPETPLTVGLKGVNKKTDRAEVRELWLCTLDANGFGSPKLLQTLMDFDGCSDGNLSSAKLKDGIYANTTLVKAQADPYFSNIRFVHAAIDANGPQTLALFEMGGNTYLISEEDLQNAVGSGSDPITLIPIFSQTMGTEVSIGSDDDNLLAVYVAPVSNSQSNAIFAAWWDKKLQTWGTPTILAMRHLQVWEDAETYELGGSEREMAYLGKTTGNEEYDAYLNDLSEADRKRAAGSEDKFTFSNLQTAVHSVEKSDGSIVTRLMVLTEGSFVGLTQASFVMGSDPAKNYETWIPNTEAMVGFYAIAFGDGEQAIGEGKLAFANEDFTAGSRLIGEVSFTNVGTAAIRAGTGEPASICLTAGSETIAEWRLNESIPSGGSIRLTFTGLPLTTNLPAGVSFSLTVKENLKANQEHPENNFSATLTNLFTVKEQPDLSFGTFRLSLNSIKDGKANLKLEAAVQNNGTAAAEQVFIQFSYGTGERDEFGAEVYAPIDISGSKLSTSLQELIEKRKLLSEGSSIGVYMLKDGYEQTDLDPGCYRVVTGTLCVPVDCFRSLTDYSGLHLRAELFSTFDNADYVRGIYRSENREYNNLDNRFETTLKHETLFSMPSRITMALGTSLHLPVTFSATSGETDIVVTELSDGTEGWTPRMGICYYDAEQKVIVAAPNSTAQAMLEAGEVPTGIIRIEDRSTNSICAVTYKVGEMAEGVNIYKDDASFTFYNSDGSPTDPDAPTAWENGWTFIDFGAEDGWTGGEPGEIPMNGDLSEAAEDDAYFTFQTVAESLKFFFMGEITIQVGEDKTVATSSPVDVDLDNPNGTLKTVTVYAKNGTKIDRYIPSYATNTVVESDPTAPKILWSRSDPQELSVEIGGSVPMTCYLLDESGLMSVSFNGQTLSESTTPALVKEDDMLWRFDWSFTENRTYKVVAQDKAGNTTTGTKNVQWFNEYVTPGTNAEAPGLTRSQVSFVDENGAPIPNNAAITEAPYLVSAYVPAANETSSACYFTDGAFTDDLGKIGAERWFAGWNGCYMVSVDRDDGTWARALIPLKGLRSDTSEEKPDLDGDGSPSSPYLIACREDWLELRRFVHAGNNTAGKYFLQIADISITDADMIGIKEAEPTSENAGPGDEIQNVHSPVGVTTLIAGGKDSVAVRGWAYDPDEPEAALTIQVRIGDEVHELVADRPVPDINEIDPAAGAYHAFDAIIHTELSGKQTVLVIAKNTGEGSDRLLGCNEVLIGAEACFRGVYDGGGFTLEFQAADAPENCAPFQFAKDATIRNLRVSGRITTRNKFAASVCANAVGGFTLENCRSDLTIKSGLWGQGYCGGLIAETAEDSAVTIAGCVTAGKLLGKNVRSCGGMVGLARGALTIRDSLFVPTELEWENAASFAHVESSAPFTLTNSYYRTEDGDTQGQRGWAILPGENIALNYGSGRNYETAGLSAYPAGLSFDGVFYTGEGEKITLTPSFLGDPEDAEPGFLASAGEFVEDRNSYVLTMPAEDVTITMVDHEWGEPFYEWAEDNTSVTCTIRCVYNPTHIQQLTVRTFFHLIKPSTRKEAGSAYYLAVFDDDRLETQRKDVTIPPIHCDGGDDCPGSRFTDMPPINNYAHIPIDWAVVNHITSGTTATTFGPKNTVTRAQVVTFLWVLFGKPNPTITENPFTDVQPGKYYYKAVLWAYENKITSGTTKTTFSPKSICTRCQVVSFLWVAAGKPEPELTENPFEDVKPGKYYYKAVLWAYENKITSGTSRTKFSPKGSCTRAQLVTFLYKEFGQ